VADTLLPIGRDHLDRDYTPDAIAAAYCRWLQIPAGARVLEPSVGGGAWARGLRATPAGVIAGADIDPDARGLREVDIPLAGDFVGDLAEGEPSTLDSAGPFDLVVGNPPFGPATAHIRQALRVAPVVAMLLRQTYIQPTPKGVVRDGVVVSEPRRDFLRAHPPRAVWYWPDRIAFGGARGGDSVLHGLHIWVRGHTGDSWTTTMCRPDDPEWMPPAVPWGGL
jgi:predicted RNA methylase